MAPVRVARAADGGGRRLVDVVPGRDDHGVGGDRELTPGDGAHAPAPQASGSVSSIRANSTPAARRAVHAEHAERSRQELDVDTLVARVPKALLRTTGHFGFGATVRRRDLARAEADRGAAQSAACRCRR